MFAHWEGNLRMECLGLANMKIWYQGHRDSTGGKHLLCMWLWQLMLQLHLWFKSPAPYMALWAPLGIGPPQINRKYSISMSLYTGICRKSFLGFKTLFWYIYLKSYNDQRIPVFSLPRSLVLNIVFYFIYHFPFFFFWTIWEWPLRTWCLLGLSFMIDDLDAVTGHSRTLTVI